MPDLIWDTVLSERKNPWGIIPACFHDLWIIWRVESFFAVYIIPTNMSQMYPVSSANPAGRQALWELGFSTFTVSSPAKNDFPPAADAHARLKGKETFSRSFGLAVDGKGAGAGQWGDGGLYWRQESRRHYPAPWSRPADRQNRWPSRRLRRAGRGFTVRVWKIRGKNVKGPAVRTHALPFDDVEKKKAHRNRLRVPRSIWVRFATHQHRRPGPF